MIYTDFHGEKLSLLGFGTMRLPLVPGGTPADIDEKTTADMVRYAMEHGVNYFDTAYPYHGGMSERVMGRVLKDYDRGSFYLATKYPGHQLSSHYDPAAIFEEQLEKCGVDYFDFYLLHNVGGPRTAKFDEYGMWDFVREQKAAGRIRNWGFSMHDGPETLDRVLTDHPEMEFVQLQVNYLDWESPVAQSRRCMEVAAEHDVPVIIMEPARGGMLVNLADRVAAPLVACSPEKSLASWAYRFCYNLPGVLTVLSGMSTIDQVRQNIADFKANEPFSPAETEALAQTREILESIAAIPCTNCRYCVKGCPQEVAIPEIMGLLNLEAQVENNKFVSDLYSWQAKPGRASDCIECGLCESMCPQQIGIIENLKTAVEHFE